MRRVMLVIGAVTGVLVLGALLLDEGEVVTLVTEAGERTYSTQLWIVELDGREFIRANRGSARWLARLRANPAVQLRRTDEHGAAAELYWAQAVENPDLKARVDAKIESKYRLADRVWGRFAHRGRSQVIELLPRSEEASSAEGKPIREPGAGS